MAYTAEQLSDLQCIRDAALRYCRGVDRLDVELMKSAYWEGATDDHGVFVGDAWEFCEMCMEAHLPWRSTNHCILNHAIELLEEAGWEGWNADQVLSSSYELPSGLFWGHARKCGWKSK